MNRRITFCLLAFAFALASTQGCAKKKEAIDPTKEEGPPAHADEAEHEPLPTQVRLPPEVIEDAKIKWAPVAHGALDTVLDLPGEITADPDRMARVSVPVEGRIEQVNFREGDRVKKGALLAMVRVVDLPQRLAALDAVSARARAAGANAERLQVLAVKGLAGAQEAESARAESEALGAEAKGEAERIDALGTRSNAARSSMLEVHAPIGGVVVERHAVVGDRAGPEHALATIVDLDGVWFLGRVFERDLASIKVGERAELELNAYPSERFDGTVEYLSEQIDPVARTLVARIHLKNRSRLLRLGLFGTARIAVGRKHETPALVVPRAAITDIEDKSVVFVRHPDGDFQRHEVVLGAQTLGRVEILSGLREGEEVVIEGVFTLKSAILKATFGEEE